MISFKESEAEYNSDTNLATSNDADNIPDTNLKTIGMKS